MHAIHVIDSHTGGEPTRLVLSGFPDLGSGSMAERLQCLRQQYDHYRAAIMDEPRGHAVLVGALLCPPQDPAHTAGVIFFNHVGYLGMCGHGTIGVVASLGYLGRINSGQHTLETPVGLVSVHWQGNVVRVRNVPSYRSQAHVPITVPGLGRVHGDIAWGGNWFYICHDHGLTLTLDNTSALTSAAEAMMQALEREGITGADGMKIDHIELSVPLSDGSADSRNFVLCPGAAWDRSPCGTGTSARVACLAADGVLAPGQVWRQQGICGSVFEASYEAIVGSARVIPSISGQAWITADAQLLLDPSDPMVYGLTRRHDHEHTLPRINAASEPAAHAGAGSTQTQRLAATRDQRLSARARVTVKASADPYHLDMEALRLNAKGGLI